MEIQFKEKDCRKGIKIMINLMQEDKGQQSVGPEAD